MNTKNTPPEDAQQAGCLPHTGSVAAFNKNTCPGCGGPGQKYPDETLYHCPNNWCDVKLFQPRTQAARGESLDDKLTRDAGEKDL